VEGWLLRVAAGMSQTINLFLLFGHHDQTVSARCYVNRYKLGWQQAYWMINGLFFWQEDHCHDSFVRDIQFAQEVLNHTED